MDGSETGVEFRVADQREYSVLERQRFCIISPLPQEGSDTIGGIYAYANQGKCVVIIAAVLVKMVMEWRVGVVKAVRVVALKAHLGACAAVVPPGSDRGP